MTLEIFGGSKYFERRFLEHRVPWAAEALLEAFHRRNTLLAQLARHQPRKGPHGPGCQNWFLYVFIYLECSSKTLTHQYFNETFFVRFSVSHCSTTVSFNIIYIIVSHNDEVLLSIDNG